MTNPTHNGDKSATETGWVSIDGEHAAPDLPCKIVEKYLGFAIYAQSRNDLKTKKKAINRGDTRGFYKTLAIHHHETLQPVTVEPGVQVSEPVWLVQKYTGGGMYVIESDEVSEYKKHGWKPFQACLTLPAPAQHEPPAKDEQHDTNVALIAAKDESGLMTAEQFFDKLSKTDLPNVTPHTNIIALYMQRYADYVLQQQRTAAPDAIESPCPFCLRNVFSAPDAEGVEISSRIMNIRIALAKEFEGSENIDLMLYALDDFITGNNASGHQISKKI